MPHLDAMHWNVNNELHKIENGTMEAFYQYSGGQRVRKWVDKGSVKEERIYLGNFEIYRKFDNTSSLIIERTTVHVSDDSGRIAMLEKRTFGLAADDNNTAATLVRYIYSNHLQSASLELDDNADIISYEEYHPYGTTSYQAMNAAINAVAKRYRYTGKERDEESGLYYHGARYYIPWLCRWTAVDPLESKYAGMSPYNYAFNNPVMYNDPSGADPTSEEIKGGWYVNEKGNMDYVKGITTKEQFEKSQYSNKGSWWSTHGVWAGSENVDVFNSDGTILRTYNESGIKILYSNKEYKKYKNDRDPKIKGWLKLDDQTYKYVSYGYLQRNGLKETLSSEVHDGITGKHYKADGSIENTPIYTSINVPSTTTPPQPKIVDTPIAVAPPKPPVAEPPKPTPQPTKEKNEVFSTIGTVSTMSASVPTTIEQGTKLIAKTANYTDDIAKIGKIASRSGTGLGILSLGSTYANYKWGNSGVSEGRYYAQQVINVIGFFSPWGVGISIGLSIIDAAYGDEIENWIRQW